MLMLIPAAIVLVLMILMLELNDRQALGKWPYRRDEPSQESRPKEDA